MTSAGSDVRRTRVDTRKILPATLLGAVLAVLVNSTLWAVMQSVLRPNLQIAIGGRDVHMVPLPLVSVLVLTVQPALLAGVLFWVLARFTTKPAFNIPSCGTGCFGAVICSAVLRVSWFACECDQP